MAARRERAADHALADAGGGQFRNRLPCLRDNRRLDAGKICLLHSLSRHLHSIVFDARYIRHLLETEWVFRVSAAIGLSTARS